MDLSAADILKLSPSSSSEQRMDMLAMMMMQMDHHQHHHQQYGSSFQNPSHHHLLPENALGFVDSTTAPPPPPQQLIYNQHNVASSSSSSSPPTVTNMPPFLFPTSEKRICGGSNMASMREMIFRIAVMQPVHIDPESVKPPKRRNVRISKDPQSVAARHRRERISEKIRILQRLVPGGTKMDTASMLDEAIHYIKFLKKQVQRLEQVGANRAASMGAVGGFPVNGTAAVSYNNSGFNMLKGSCQPQPCSSQSQMMTGAMQQVFN